MKVRYGSDISLFLVCMLLVPVSLPAIDLGLVDMLTSKLGVTKPQAAGGAGAIFSYAKNKMTPENFGKLAGAVPDMNNLLAAAPKTDVAKSTAEGSASAPAEGGSGLSGLATPASGAAGLGGVAGSLAGLQSLGGSFGQLGLKPDMVGKFVPVITDYVRSSGGEGVSTLLTTALH